MPCALRHQLLGEQADRLARHLRERSPYRREGWNYRASHRRVVKPRNGDITGDVEPPAE